jgi:hypothetical protein
MYLTIQNIHKIIQTLWTNPLWIDNLIIQKDKYIIEIYIGTNQKIKHTIEIMRKQNQLLQSYELIINGTINSDIAHYAILDKKDFVQWIHNQLMYHYPIYF